MLFFATVSLLSTVFVLILHHHTNIKKPPQWLHDLVFQYLVKILKTNVKPYSVDKDKTRAEQKGAKNNHANDGGSGVWGKNVGSYWSGGAGNAWNNGLSGFKTGASLENRNSPQIEKFDGREWKGEEGREQKEKREGGGVGRGGGRGREEGEEGGVRRREREERVRRGQESQSLAKARWKTGFEKIISFGKVEKESIGGKPKTRKKTKCLTQKKATADEMEESVKRQWFVIVVTFDRVFLILYSTLNVVACLLVFVILPIMSPTRVEPTILF